MIVADLLKLYNPFLMRIKMMDCFELGLSPSTNKEKNEGIHSIWNKARGNKNVSVGFEIKRE